MSIANSKPTLVAGTGEPTLFDSLARLVPKELQAAYYRVLAHTRTLSPDDEMLRILEAMGTLTLLTRHTPKEIAEERQRLQEVLAQFEQCSNDTQKKMVEYLRVLDARITTLPDEIEAVLNPRNLAEVLGESIRQHFLRSGLPRTVEALQASSAAIVRAQTDLTKALARLCDGHYGVLAEVEAANRRVAYSLENRAKAIDALLAEVKHDILRLWVPLLCGASLLIGLISGMTIQNWRDEPPEPPQAVRPSAVQMSPSADSPGNTLQPVGKEAPPHDSRGATGLRLGRPPR